MFKIWKSLTTLVGVSLLVGGALLPAQEARTHASASGESATIEKIIQYLREKYGLPDVVKVTAEPLQPSSYPAFYQTLVTVDDGKQKRTQNVALTKDRRYLLVGSIFLLSSDPKAEIVRYVRQAFKVPEATSLTVGPFRTSPFPNFYVTTITATAGAQKQTQDFYVTKDYRCLVLGNVFSLAVDPRHEVLRTISVRNQASQGPAGAPVTIVEYSDLQCPMCARLHEFLEKELLPRYGNKVRVVFKEFPLVAIHDWTLNASIANQCVYEINPVAFVPFRSLVFQNQSSLNVTNSRDMLLNFGEQAGVDRVKLAGCLDSKASLPRIEESTQEGRRLQIQSTPTCYINGRMIVGMPSADAYFKLVEEALRDGAKRRGAS